MKPYSRIPAEIHYLNEGTLEY